MFEIHVGDRVDCTKDEASSIYVAASVAEDKDGIRTVTFEETN